MISSTISFSSLPEEQIILLQLEPALINKRLTIKSSGQNGSVICTPDATFMLKDVQQSNSLLFLTTDAEGEDLTLDYNAKSWLEIVPVVRPKIDLSMIPTWDGEGETSSVTRNSIEGSIAASSREIQEAMFEGLCVCLDAARIVRLDSNYCLRLLNLIVNTAIANDLDLATISEDQVLTVMQDDHENTKVIKFLLARFSKYPCSPYNLDGAKIAKFSGMHTLALLPPDPTPLFRFQTVWTRNTPLQYHNCLNSLTLLRGQYIHPTPTSIIYYPAEKLPVDPKARFGELFGSKVRWTEDEIIPFLEDLVDGKEQAVQVLLMKHARKVKVGREVFIESRVKR